MGIVLGIDKFLAKNKTRPIKIYLGKDEYIEFLDYLKSTQRMPDEEVNRIGFLKEVSYRGVEICPGECPGISCEFQERRFIPVDIGAADEEEAGN